jgi:hypothetical protein
VPPLQESLAQSGAQAPKKIRRRQIKRHNILYCINAFIQYTGAITNAIHTKWKFIVQFEDEETGEIAGTLGEAADRDECEVLVEDEMEYQRLRGYIRLTAEAVELCE